jgi:hypothetical protein
MSVMTQIESERRRAVGEGGTELGTAARCSPWSHHRLGRAILHFCVRRYLFAREIFRDGLPAQNSKPSEGRLAERRRPLDNSAELLARQFLH